jgi:sulfate permease, SulP family
LRGAERQNPGMLRLAPTLHGYRRAWLAGDAAAAAALLVIAVPEQIATSQLAGMPPITGLYAFLAGGVMYALLGTNPALSVGADSTIAPLFAAGVATIAATGSLRYEDLVGILAVMVAVLVALVWLLRLGWIAELLSAPIITGFLAGIGVVIVVHQLPDLLGIPGGGTSTLARLKDIADQLGAVNGPTLAIGLGVLAVVAACERIDRRLPGALIALVGSVALVSLADLQQHGVAVLGPVAHSAPRFGLHGLTLHAVGSLSPVAATVALVVVTQSAATTRAFARRSDNGVDVGRDLLAVGAGNAVAGLIGSFPVNASPPRTAAAATVGGRSALSLLLAAAAVAALIPAANVLRNVPLATLAGVLLFVAARLFNVREILRIARFDRLELALALATLLTVAFVGVEQGIAVAVGLAILERTWRSARPQLHVLGRIPGTTSWAPMSMTEGAAEVPGILVVLFATPLWYANSVHFDAQLRAALKRSAGGPPRLLVLDTLGMSDVDYTGAEALSDALDRLDAERVEFAVARAGNSLREELRRSGLEQRIGEDHFFPSVDRAVAELAGMQLRA